MPTTPSLGLADTRDAAAMASLSRRYIEAGLEPSWTAERITRAIRHRDSTVVVAHLGRELAGFAIMQFGDSTAHLNLLAVAAGHRRQGLGRRLLCWLEDSAATAGAFVIRLECRIGNRDAVRFYRALGYRETGVVTRYYQGVEDAIRMERDLSRTTLA
jgi:ribosomal protein S18 acetylase RimI-like enzyme